MWRLIKRGALIVLGCVLLGEVVGLGTTAPGKAVFAVIAWVLVIYLVVRAWPAVRRDLETIGLLGGRAGKLFRVSRRRDSGQF